MRILILFFTAILLAGCTAPLGEPPSPEEEAKFALRPTYTDGQFTNYEQAVTTFRGKPSLWRLFRHFAATDNAPADPLPRVEPNENTFAVKSPELSVMWLGHSSLIVELDKVRFAVDPVFGNASPVPGFVKRYMPPPFPLEKLPQLDFVILTHDHYDHLEYAAIRHLRHSDTEFIVPLGVGARLRGWGIERHRIYELYWDETVNLYGLQITAQTSRHFSGRTLDDRNKTLWASFVIEGKNKKIFLSGDSGYGEHFKKIGDEFGPFDLACIEIDAWNHNWINHHIHPEQVTTAYEDLRANLLLPIHWGVFDLAGHKWDLSIRRIAYLADAMDINLVTPLPGEKILPGATPTRRWWEGLK